VPDVCPAAAPAAGRPVDPAEREARIEAVLQEIARRFGPHVAYRLAERRPVIGEQALSTGALSLDLAMRIGGVPRRRITEVTGPASSGKHTLACHVLAAAQRDGGCILYIDAAHRADFALMAACGVDCSGLFLAVPGRLAEVFEAACMMLESGGLDALVIDALDGLAGHARPAARAAARGLARLAAIVPAAPTAVLFVTEEPGSAALAPFRRALRHTAALRIALAPLQLLVHPSGDIAGLRVRATVVKNRLGPWPRTAVFDLRRGRGVDRAGDLLTLGCACGVVRQETLGLCFGTRYLGRGRAQAIEALESEPALARALEHAVRQRLSAP
jgi:recombination protein RecA